MQFTIDSKRHEIAIDNVIVAGWTGRDGGAVQHHIDELAALGVAPPSRVPLFYRVSSGLLTRAPMIQVLGRESSGEAEPLLVYHDGRLWLGLASDHTDRQLETHSVAASKQACAKPCADTLWDFASLAPRADDLRLRSWIRDTGDWTLYQDGSLAGLLPLADLARAAGLRDGDAMLCGTLAAIGGVRPAAEFRARLDDPETGNGIELVYRSEVLPVVA